MVFGFSNNIFFISVDYSDNITLSLLIMLRGYTRLQYQHTLELLQIYRLAVARGQFDKNKTAKALRMLPGVVEGMWYSEIRRARKYRHAYDWKTKLNHNVMQQLSQNNTDVHLLDVLISAFESKKVTHALLFELLDG